MRIYLLPLMLVACGTALSAMAELTVPLEQQIAVAQIDFDALHSQANAALEKLRQSQDRRMAQASAAVF
jgi:hypothetical protein